MVCYRVVGWSEPPILLDFIHAVLVKFQEGCTPADVASTSPAGFFRLLPGAPFRRELGILQKSTGFRSNHWECGSIRHLLLHKWTLWGIRLGDSWE